MGFAAIIIHDATIIPSVKKDRASLILRLFNVDKYLYVTKKFDELTIDEFRTKKTPIRPKSTLPIAVYLTRPEKGVIIAQPGKTSFAFFSTDHTKDSSLPNLRYRVF